MKVLVPVKRVVDYNVKVRVKSDGTGVARPLPTIPAHVNVNHLRSSAR